jgi:hypothetical protein
MDFSVSAVWSTSYKNNLPDSAFLYVESGGKKDDEGKTVPRSLRHFPYKDSNGKIDIIHLRNAIARIPVSDIPKGLKKPLQDKARKILKERNKKSKAGLFNQILNKLANEQSKAASSSACCLALEELKYTSNQELMNVYNTITPREMAVLAPGVFIRTIARFIKYYCQCLNSPQTLQDAECSKEVEQFLKTAKVKFPITNDPKLMSRHTAYGKVLFQALKFFKKITTTYAQAYFNYNIDGSDNINFMKNFCDFYNTQITNGTVDPVRQITGTMLEEVDISLKEAIEEFLQLIPLASGVEEAQIADCEVSAENDSVKGWASALAVSAATAAAAIALYRLTRGRSAKACTPDGKTKGVRILSGLLCGAAAGSATQNAPAQETCDAVAEQIVNDECSPNPSLCEPPSGGGGSQPPGGEVEPPSGGGGGVMGGDGLL